MNILVTAGPTREPLDPVRFLSNRSTGKMGYAVAAAALARGHSVVLVSGPVALQAPDGATVVRVTTAEEMLHAVEAHATWCDGLVMAAAPADWRPKHQSPTKLKKSAARRTLELEPTTDILGSLRGRKGQRVFVGFAAETGDPEAEAGRKLREKELDLVVANDVTAEGAGFESDTNIVMFVAPGGDVRRLPRMSKREVGERVIEWMEAAPRVRPQR
jgi:phosphopantothenoylcysteine decarboxylase/phosphopantothenate--cysteine ligase